MKTGILPSEIAKADHATYAFASSDAAWKFMRTCDEAGLYAGYPAYRTNNVQVALLNWADRELADRLAGSIPVEYRVGTQETLKKEE